MTNKDPNLGPFWWIMIGVLSIATIVLLASCGPVTAEKTFQTTTPIVGNATNTTIYTPIIINFTNAQGDQPRIIAAGYQFVTNTGGGGSVEFGFHDDVTLPCSSVTPITSANFLAGTTSNYAAWGQAVIAELNNRTSGRYLMCVVVTQTDINNPVNVELLVDMTGEFVIVP